MNRFKLTGFVCSFVLSILCASGALATDTRKIVYLIGSNGVAYHVANGGHEYLLGAQTWTNVLSFRGHAVTNVVQYLWPSDSALDSLFDDADAIVMYGNGGGIFGDTDLDHCQNDFFKNHVMDRLMQVANRGVPVGMVHYIMEPPTAINWGHIGMPPVYATNQIKGWVGGFYASYWVTNDHQSGSWNEEWTPATTFPAHPINQGIPSYTLFDEWYADIWFTPGANISPFLQGTGHVRAPSTTETLGWAFLRPDGTRGFGFTGGHYQTNWDENMVLTTANAKTSTHWNVNLLLNAIEWIARVNETNRFQTVVPAGSVWKFDADGSMDTNWNQSGFNDGAWASGAAPLGYDDWAQDWIVTQVAAGSAGNRPVTTWFRKAFNVSSTANVTNLLVKINADDGAVVYLNGNEVGRYNMPSGTVTPSTVASNSLEVNWNSIFRVCPYTDADWTNNPGMQSTWLQEYYDTFADYNTPEFNWGRILAGTGYLQNGTNILAIEVHQKDTSNPDMRLDVEAQLLGNDQFIPGSTGSLTSAPTVNTGSGASSVTPSTATLNGNVTSTGMVPTQVSIVWGGSDAGTSLGSWAHVVSLGYQAAGAVSTPITGLSAGTTYYYRVFATNSAGPGWSSAASFATPVATFTAYNDLGPSAGQPTNRITTHVMDGTTNGLTDYVSGQPLSVQVAMAGGTLWPGTGAGYAPAGTPAVGVFPSNIIDCAVHSYFDAATVSFSGLVPTNLYTFVFYANRDGSATNGNYTNRFTTVNIQGATSFLNDSTAGAANQAAASATIMSGVSHGNVFQFDQVNPGSDGIVTFQFSGSNPCLNAFMVQTPSTNGASGSTNSPGSGSDWTAYDDTAWTASSGQTPSANDLTGNFTTNSPHALLSGHLLDSATATQLAVQVDFNVSAASGVSLLDRAFGPPLGSDAAAWFSGKIGTNCAANWTSGTVAMAVSGLDSSRQYNIVLWSTRGADGAQYSNRFTDIVLSGADSFVNRSSAGTEISTQAAANDKTRVRSTLAGGLVVRYDNINPGSDGTVTFQLTAGADALWAGQGTVTNGYLNGLMIQTVPASSTSVVVPDVWKTQYFGTTNVDLNADPDHDGLSNLQEYIAGCAPNNSNSAPILDLRMQGGALKLDFGGVTQRLYSIDYKTNVLGAWQALLADVLGSNATQFVTLTQTNALRYYRFRVRLAP